MEFSELKIAIVGAGRWGKNHVRTAASILPPQNITVCDTRTETAKIVKGINNNINFTTDISKVLEDKKISAAIVATPAETHFDVASKFIDAGKHVLVEKPITLHTEEARKLLKLAKDKNVKLMVGHVLLYHPAILKMKELIDRGMMGKIQYIYSNRLNLGSIRQEENILWSFAPHDISVIQFLTGTAPVSIDAKGGAYVQNKIEDTTLTYLEYPNNIKAHIFVSWLNPFKEQKLVVIGEQGMFVFEDSIKENKLRFYPKGFRDNQGKLEIFDEGVFLLKFPEKMPLTEEHNHFYDCVINGKTPRTDGEHALEVLEILEKATEKLKNSEC